MFRVSLGVLILADQSFGRGKANALDPRRFAAELDSHLRKEIPENDQFESIAAALNHEMYQINAAENSGCLSSMQRLSSIGDSLSTCSRVIEKYFDERDTLSETEFMERLYEFKSFVRGGKCTWHHSKVNESDQFLPVKVSVLGGGEVFFGSFKSKSVNPQFASCAAVGFKVSHCKPVHQKLAWETFQVMTELATYRSSLFPFPLNAHFDSTRAAVFSFENPKCVPLKHFLSAALSVNLMKYPRVILAWCRQFYAAVCVLKLKGGRILAPQPNLTSTFIRENGTLVLGDQLFEPSNGALQLKRNKESIGLLVRYFSDLLSSVLSLSRTEHVSVSVSSADDSREETIYIAQGGCLSLRFTGSEVDKVLIETAAEDITRARKPDIRGIQEDLERALLSEDSTEDNDKILYVDIQGNPRTVEIMDRSNGGIGILEIKAKSTGAVTLKVYSAKSVRVDGAQAEDASMVSDDGDGNSRHHSSVSRGNAIHLSVLPPPLSTSMELQELVHLIQSAAQCDNKELLLEAQALRQNV